MYLDPIWGVRLVVCDTSTKLCGVVVTSPLNPHKLELAVTVDAFTKDPDVICDAAIAQSEKDGAPCWMVIEDPGVGGPRSNPTIVLGMGQAIGIFRRSWIMSGGGDSRCLMVRQVTWCAGMIPTAYDREARKKESKRQAPIIWGSDQLGLLGVSSERSEIDWTEDLADAGMIASFMLRWPEFVDTIGPMDRKAADRFVQVIT